MFLEFYTVFRLFSDDGKEDIVIHEKKREGVIEKIIPIREECN